MLTGVLALSAATTGLLATSANADFLDTTLPAADREAARDTGKILALTTDALILCSIGAAARSPC